MDEEKDIDYSINTCQLLQLISQFLKALNVPVTHAVFQKELAAFQKNVTYKLEPQGVQSANQVIQHSQSFQKLENKKQNHNSAKIEESQGLNVDAMKEVLSKCASFSQILDKVEESEGKSYHPSWLSNPDVMDEEDRNNLKIVNQAKSKPRLVDIFSAFQSVSKIKKVTIPVFHILRIQPKTSKPIKFISVSPCEHNVLIIDSQSNLFIYNTSQKSIQYEQKKDNEGIISTAKWISDDHLVIGKTNGSLNVASFNTTFKIIVKDKQVHFGSVMDIFEFKNFIYTIGSDHCLSKISKIKWKLLNTYTTSLTSAEVKNSFNNPVCKIVKLDEDRLNNISFLMDRSQGRIWMIDEMTEMEKDIFKVNVHFKKGVISNMLAHQKSLSLIVGISDQSIPEIYQIYPLTNQIILRISGFEIVNKSLPFNSKIKGKNKKTKKLQKVFLSFYDDSSQILNFTCTQEKSKVFYVSLRNWKNLYTQDCKEQEAEIFQCGGIITNALDGVQEEQKFRWQEIKKKKQEILTESAFNLRQNSKILVCLNAISSNVEIYSTSKSEFSVIKAQERLNLLALGANLSRGTEGFLTLIQNIRENYNTFF